MAQPSKLEKHKKIALITGASSGIGYELSKILAHEGYELILFGRNEKVLLTLQLEIGTPSHIFVADFSSKNGQKLLVDTISAHMPDLVVNNAGIGFYGELSSDDIEDTIEVNCTTLALATQRAARVLKASGKEGIILNVSSSLAFIPAPLMSVYAASKAFVSSFSMAQDAELKAYGIRVLTACPGQVETGFRRRAAKGVVTQGGNSFFRMMPKKVAAEIWKQIQAKKPLNIIDWKTNLLIHCTKLLPKRLIYFFFRREIRARMKN